MAPQHKRRNSDDDYSPEGPAVKKRVTQPKATSSQSTPVKAEASRTQQTLHAYMSTPKASAGAVRPQSAQAPRAVYGTASPRRTPIPTGHFPGANSRMRQATTSPGTKIREVRVAHTPPSAKTLASRTGALSRALPTFLRFNPSAPLRTSTTPPKFGRKEPIKTETPGRRQSPVSPSASGSSRSSADKPEASRHRQISVSTGDATSSRSSSDKTETAQRRQTPVSNGAAGSSRSSTDNTSTYIPTHDSSSEQPVYTPTRQQRTDDTPQKKAIDAHKAGGTDKSAHAKDSKAAKSLQDVLDRTPRSVERVQQQKKQKKLDTMAQDQGSPRSAEQVQQQKKQKKPDTMAHGQGPTNLPENGHSILQSPIMTSTPAPAPQQTFISPTFIPRPGGFDFAIPNPQPPVTPQLPVTPSNSHTPLPYGPSDYGVPTNQQAFHESAQLGAAAQGAHTFNQQTVPGTWSSTPTLNQVLPENVYSSLDHYMTTHGVLNEGDRMWVMGVQYGIGLGVETLRKSLLDELQTEGKIFGHVVKPEHADENLTAMRQKTEIQCIAQFDLRQAAGAAAQFVANQETLAKMIIQQGLVTALPQNGGFVGTCGAGGPLLGPHAVNAVSTLDGNMNGPYIGNVDVKKLDGVAAMVGNAMLASTIPPDVPCMSRPQDYLMSPEEMQAMWATQANTPVMPANFNAQDGAYQTNGATGECQGYIANYHNVPNVGMWGNYMPASNEGQFELAEDDQGRAVITRIPQNN
ncbi:Uu.00g063580.m01.CDS01 [Anthostomella pinea]|uniref:Uu.00g063580.m01.CDS01 n=1 Tax=Anthostomella pinea TaxID=933095 RepID=A0AAI8VTF3_9PEZI|nr:Uu.00g063580.m01.CDS01 [Anthostomella pinea]